MPSCSPEALYPVVRETFILIRANRSIPILARVFWTCSAVYEFVAIFIRCCLEDRDSASAVRQGHLGIVQRDEADATGMSRGPRVMIQRASTTTTTSG